SAPRPARDVLRAGAVSSPSRPTGRFRSRLVVTEMAVSAMLLVGAVLLARTVASLQHTDLGFDPTNLHAVMPELPESQFPTPEARLAAVRRLADAMRAIPGVRELSITDAIPSYRNFSIG